MRINPTPIARLRMLFFTASLLTLAAITGARADEVENVPEVGGFWGVVTGKVKSAQADGRQFVLQISKAEAEARSVLKDGAPLAGKELTVGVRMPNKDGVSFPNPEDVAYLKTLQPGMVITVKLFAPRSDPRVLRIQGPGQTVVAPGAAKK